MLPAKNRVEDTVRYFMVDALGLDFLTNAFMAQYRDGEAKFTAFVARCKSADNAAEVLAKYKVHLEEFGDMAEPAKIEGASVMFADMGGDHFVGACQVGDVIVGVTEVKGRDAAVKAMTFLLKGLMIPKMTWRGVCYANRALHDWLAPGREPTRKHPPEPPLGNMGLWVRIPSPPYDGGARGGSSAVCNPIVNRSRSSRLAIPCGSRPTSRSPPASSTGRSPASTAPYRPGERRLQPPPSQVQRHGLVCLGHDHAGGGVRRAPPRSPDIFDAGDGAGRVNVARLPDEDRLEATFDRDASGGEPRIFHAAPKDTPPPRATWRTKRAASIRPCRRAPPRPPNGRDVLLLEMGEVLHVRIDHRRRRGRGHRRRTVARAKAPIASACRCSARRTTSPKPLPPLEDK